MTLSEFNRIERDKWLEVALEDFRVAEMGLSRDFLALRTSVFHAQQCAEKVIKTLFIVGNRKIIRTHDLWLLAQKVQDICDLSAHSEDLQWLSEWAIAGRYPGDCPDPFIEDAEKALHIAKAIFDLISPETLKR